ncbi:MAG: glutamine amidotransferase [Methanoregula sp.]|nr:glutamine amidotransferase [Methanoregula sp.]
MPSIYLYIPDTLADWEPAHVLAELRSGRYLKDPSLRYGLVLCGRTMDTITTMGGLHLKPDVPITDIMPEAGDLLLLPGADTWLAPEQAPVIAKVSEVMDRDTVVAAICGATLGLANAGRLDKRPHTSNDLTALKMFCPGYHGEQSYVNEPAVTDGNLITASGLAPVEFAYQVFRKLEVMHPATLDAWYGLFTTRKPECFYALMQSLPPPSAPE